MSLQLLISKFVFISAKKHFTFFSKTKKSSLNFVAFSSGRAFFILDRKYDDSCCIMAHIFIVGRDFWNSEKHFFSTAAE
jgi:hypothetical protein